MEKRKRMNSGERLVISAWLSLAVSICLDISCVSAQKAQTSTLCQQNNTLAGCSNYNNQYNDASYNIVSGSWYFWVAGIVGLTMIGIASGTYYRIRMRNRITCLNAINTARGVPQPVPVIGGPQVIHRYPGQMGTSRPGPGIGQPMMIQTVNAYANPSHYFDPAGGGFNNGGYIIQPPPYSPPDKLSVPAPPAYSSCGVTVWPPPTFSSTELTSEEKDSSVAGDDDTPRVALSAVHPMRPGYRMTGDNELNDQVTNAVFPQQNIYVNNNYVRNQLTGNTPPTSGSAGAGVGGTPRGFPSPCPSYPGTPSSITSLRQPGTPQGSTTGSSSAAIQQEGQQHPRHTPRGVSNAPRRSSTSGEAPVRPCSSHPATSGAPQRHPSAPLVAPDEGGRGSVAGRGGERPGTGGSVVIETHHM